MERENVSISPLPEPLYVTGKERGTAYASRLMPAEFGDLELVEPNRYGNHQWQQHHQLSANVPNNPVAEQDQQGRQLGIADVVDGKGESTQTKSLEGKQTCGIKTKTLWIGILILVLLFAAIGASTVAALKAQSLDRVKRDFSE